MFFPFEFFKYSLEAMLRMQRAYAENVAAALALSTKAAEDVLQVTHALQSFLTIAAKPLPYHAEGNVLVIDRTPVTRVLTNFPLGGGAALYQFRQFQTGH